MKHAFDVWLIDRYRNCWRYFGPSTRSYVPVVRIEVDPQGKLIRDPILLNPPTGDKVRERTAKSALDAVRRCHPMAVPERFKGVTDRWRHREIRFDPAYLQPARPGKTSG